MPRKAKKKKPSDIKSPAFESTVKQLQSMLVDPRMSSWLWSGARGVRSRIMTMNFDVLRNVADKLTLVGGIINNRIDQILPFCVYNDKDNGDPGFKFELSSRMADPSDYSDKEVDLLATFLEQTGFNDDSMREDDFADFVSMVVRETLTIDQVATEIQRNRIGDAVAFWLLDGATVKRVTTESDFKRGVRFIQQIDEQVYNEFTGDMLLFDYKFKRADIRYRGYGYACLEQAVDIITTLLFGFTYAKDQLVKDKTPRGFISVMGDIDGGQIDAIRSYWYAAMTGAGAQFNIPILPSGKDGVGMDFKQIGHNNKDMEYHKTMMFFSSILSTVFSMDLMELGLKMDNTSNLIGESSEPRISSSKDRGLGSLLMFVQQYVNKIVRKVTKKYTFKFVGLRKEDEKNTAEILKAQISGWRSIDEVREERGDEPYKEPWSSMPLHPQAVQIFMGNKNAGQNEGDFDSGEDNKENITDEDFNNNENIQKSLVRYNGKQVKVIRHIIE